EILTPDAVELVAELQRRFGPSRRKLLEARAERRGRLSAGEMLDFLPATRELREADWQVEPGPVYLRQRWVEITGPTDRKMVINALDFGLYMFHCAQRLLSAGSGPYLYLPKLESHLEARLWNEVLCFAEDALGIRRGTIKATVLIETLPAAFEMHEILFELREHSAGLNCGRWDYMFSFLKKQPDVLLPDRGQLTMDRGFLRAYAQLLIQTCHRRRAHAMGG